MNEETTTPKQPHENALPDDIFAPEKEAYEPTDIFQWANNLVQYKDELHIDLFFFNKNGIVYRTSRSKDLDKQMEPIFIDEILEYVLDGAEKGMVVRGFEEAEAEADVLQRTRLKNVEKAVEVLNWVKTQESEMELFSDETHEIKRMKGAIARVSHDGMPTFYVIKQLPAAQMMSGKVGWMVRNGKFVPFDADAAIRIPADNQLLVLESDMYVFSQPKLKSLFGYDAKEAFIADQKVKEIEANFRLSFPEGMTIQNLVKGRRSTIKKLQKIEPTLMTQEQLLNHAEEVGVALMEDDSGAIIIMDEKDLVKFVNLLNDDYIESPVTGLRYEIKSKKPLKEPDSKDDDSLLIQI
jgi:hypothetical protein